MTHNPFPDPAAVLANLTDDLPKLVTHGCSTSASRRTT